MANENALQCGDSFHCIIDSAKPKHSASCKQKRCEFAVESKYFQLKGSLNWFLFAQETPKKKKQRVEGRIYMCTHNALACNKCALNHIQQQQQQQRYAADVSVYLYLGQECKLQLANQDGCPLCHSGKWLMKMPCNAETVFIALLIRLSQNTQPRANKNAASSPWSRNISSLKVH